jgi:hypothetical protein
MPMSQDAAVTAATAVGPGALAALEVIKPNEALPQTDEVYHRAGA